MMDSNMKERFVNAGKNIGLFEGSFSYAPEEAMAFAEDSELPNSLRRICLMYVAQVSALENQPSADARALGGDGQ